MDVSFPFHPEHVPLKSTFLSGSDHTSIVSEEELESRNDILSNSDLPSTCDDIIESITLEDPFDSCGFDSNDVLSEGILQKVVYPGNRRFLPLDDVQRTDCKNYPSKATNTTLPPVIKTMEYIDKANKDYDEASGVERKTLIQKTGCKGAYALRRASSHNRILNTPVDPMHLVKNIVEHVVNVIVGSEDSV